MNDLNAMPGTDLLRVQQHGREGESFYHLSGCSLTGKVCNGTAQMHLERDFWP
jgi:hypothetical protein